LREITFSPPPRLRLASSAAFSASRALSFSAYSRFFRWSIFFAFSAYLRSRSARLRAASGAPVAALRIFLATFFDLAQLRLALSGDFAALAFERACSVPAARARRRACASFSR
jgi:hypothetical protein